MGRLLRGLKAGSFDWYFPGWAWPPPPPESYAGSDAGVYGSSAAMNISAVYACTRLIADTFASLPLQLYRRGEGSDRDRAEDHPLYRVLHDAPNPHMSAFTWKQSLMYHELHWGNAYNEVERSNGGRGAITALWPMMPDRVKVRWDETRTARLYDHDEGGGHITTLPESKVFHVPALGYNGLTGFPPLTLMRRELEGYTNAREFGSSFFKHGARPAVVVTHPKLMSNPAVKRLRAQLDELRGAGNAGKTVLMEEGADFKELGIPPENAQFIQTRTFHVGEIARWFRVPPHMIGEVSGSTSWGTGIEQQKQGFLDFTMAPWMAGFTGAVTQQLLTIAERRMFAEFETGAFLMADILKRYQAYAIGRSGGWLNANEIRAKENLNARTDDGGTEFLLPLNMASVGGTEDELPELTIESIPDPRTSGNGMRVPLMNPAR